MTTTEMPFDLLARLYDQHATTVYKPGNEGDQWSWQCRCGVGNPDGSGYDAYDLAHVGARTHVANAYLHALGRAGMLGTGAVARRSWSFPDPPDETVTALRSGADNSLWVREGERWRYAGCPDRYLSGTSKSWPDLLRHCGPLFDATEEQR